MQSNPKCIKKILEYIDLNTGVKIDQMDDTISLKSINFLMVINEVSKDGEFSAEIVAYNTLLCKKFGLIECKFEQNGNSYINGKCNIFDTTIKGEQFLRDEIELKYFFCNH